MAPLFPGLKEVVIFGAGTDETTYLVSLLPKLSLSEKGLEPIFKKLNSNFSEISMQSTRITPQGVDAVISALPSTLRITLYSRYCYRRTRKGKVSPTRQRTGGPHWAKIESR